MSWFLAFPIAPTAWLSSLPPPPEGLRLVAPCDLHLTIAFLGECGEEQARAAFCATSVPLAATEVGFGEVVPMGNPRWYSALSVVLARGREAVERAIGEAREGAWAAAAATPDPRAPKAHITLARPSRKATEEARRAGLAWAAALDLRHVVVCLEAVALYTSSHRPERGGAYRILETKRLSPSGNDQG